MLSCRLLAIVTTGLMGFTVAEASSAGSGPATWTVQLDLTPVAASSITAGAMKVDEEIAADPAPMVLRLDTMAPGLERIRDQVTALSAHDDAGVLPFRQSGASADGAALRWAATRSARGTVFLSYVMPAALPHPRKRGPHTDLQAVGDGVSGAFSGFLLAPEGTLHTTVRWHLAPRQTAVSSLGDGDINVTCSDEELRRALFLAGTLQEVPSPLPNAGEGAVALGRDVRLRPVADWFARVHAAERQAFHAPADSRFRVLIRSYDGGPFSSGRAARNGFLFYLPEGQDLDTLANRATVAHEFVHSLSSNLDDEIGNQGLWYTEGAAEYFSTMLPYAAGLYTSDQYLTIAREMATGYYTNPLRQTTNASLDQLMWSGRIAWNVPYKRGMMYFVDLNSKLRQHRTGLTVLDLVNEVTARLHAGAPQNNRTWADLLAQRVGGWAVADWQAMLGGRLIVPAGDAFGPCFERRPRWTGLFDLGFAKPAAVHEGETVSGVDPGGPAARAGLEDGDVIARTIDINAPSLQFDQPITLSVLRSGKLRTVRYDPHKGMVIAYEWRRKTRATNTCPASAPAMDSKPRP